MDGSDDVVSRPDSAVANSLPSTTRSKMLSKLDLFIGLNQSDSSLRTLSEISLLTFTGNVAIYDQQRDRDPNDGTPSNNGNAYVCGEEVDDSPTDDDDDRLLDQ